MVNRNFQIFHFKDFKIHLLEGYIQQIPVVEYKDKILILDGGCRTDVSLISSHIKNVMKKSLKDVKLVVASHTHPDHSGGVGFFRKHFKIPVAAPSGINSWYSGFRGFFQHKIDIMLGHYVAVMSKFPFKPMYYPRKTVFDYGLESKTRLPFFEDWTVLSTKGHTNHDVVFFNEKESILYAADVILKVKNRFYLPIPVPFPYLMKKSLGLIYSLRPEHIFLAHGGYMEGKLMDKAYPVLLNQADVISQGELTKSPVYRLTTITPEIKKQNRIK